MIEKSRVAFVFDAFFASGEVIRIETMPFALNVLRRLSEQDFEIDLFLRQKKEESCLTPFPSNVHVKFISTYSRKPRYSFFQLLGQFAFRRGYESVFTVGQEGSAVGLLLSRVSSCPLIILNDEFPGVHPKSIWHELERWASRDARAIIVPCAGRRDHLYEKLGLNVAKPCFVFPNMAKLEPVDIPIDWQARLQIPAGKRVFLCAGNLSDWSQVPELLSSVPYWPEDVVILLNSKSANKAANYRMSLSHLDLPGRVFWMESIISEPELNSLNRYCAGSFALYRDYGSNTHLMGMSSGKLMRSLAAGTPVIATQFESLSFVSNERVGVLVKHPSEIPGAIAHLIENLEDYRKRCLVFAERLQREENESWEELLELIMTVPRSTVAPYAHAGPSR